MADKESIKAKIRALSLKTAANGATASEEAAAKEMIARLLEKIGAPPNPQPSTIRQAEQPSKSYFEYVSLYQKYKKEGTLQKHATEIDWDAIAQKLFDRYTYGQYIQRTHSAWERRTKTELGIVEESKDYLTETNYRYICYKAFKQLEKEMKL